MDETFVHHQEAKTDILPPTRIELGLAPLNADTRTVRRSEYGAAARDSHATPPPPPVKHERLQQQMNG